MAAYLLVDLDIHDADGFQEYRSKVPEFIAKHGGEYLVAGGEFEVLEGDWQPRRLALFKFPDRQSIRNFFTDPDFASAAAVRRRSCHTVAVAVDGIE
jgi:uncharacterized protein (DUF1330 family)